MEQSLFELQSILGTDKKNPLFSVHRDRNKNELHVYYGLELLEIVPDDKESPRFKLMIAQLYNAGVKGITLSDVFKVDRKIMRNWGRALKSGDPQVLVNALKGRGPRKLTPEVKAFVRMRFPIIYEEDRRTYSSRLRQEIYDVFNITLSGEALRPYFNELKAQGQRKQEAEDLPPVSPDAPPPGEPEQTTPETIPPADCEAENPSAKKGALLV